MRAKRVLVADDNEANRTLVVTRLRRLGYEVQAVCDGREVLAAYADGVWDAILMDCQMPEMDGFEATRAIRAQEAPSNKRVLIIALTGNHGVEDRDACLDAGMDDYLTKPVKGALLEDMLRRHLP